MQEFNKEKYSKNSDFFKAIGHPTRLWIVEQLGKKERCVCEFVDANGVDFSTISKHLSVLKNTGIIADDKRGKSVYYHLKCSCILDFVDCIKKLK